jgi:large conductance mechanosensitive channel
MWQEFKAFLTKTNALAMAVGVVIGVAVGKVVSAIVDDLIMPIVGMVTPSGDWREIGVGPKDAFKVGHFAGTVVDFVIVAFVIFWLAKALLREKPKAPPPAMKDCPECLASIPKAARRCQACTSMLSA